MSHFQFHQVGFLFLCVTQFPCSVKPFQKSFKITHNAVLGFVNRSTTSRCLCLPCNEPGPSAVGEERPWGTGRSHRDPEAGLEAFLYKTELSTVGHYREDFKWGLGAVYRHLKGFEQEEVFFLLITSEGKVRNSWAKNHQRWVRSLVCVSGRPVSKSLLHFYPLWICVQIPMVLLHSFIQWPLVEDLFWARHVFRHGKYSGCRIEKVPAPRSLHLSGKPKARSIFWYLEGRIATETERKLDVWSGRDICVQGAQRLLCKGPCLGWDLSDGKDMVTWISRGRASQAGAGPRQRCYGGNKPGSGFKEQKRGPSQWQR